MATPPWLSFAVPGISIAAPHLPFFSVTTNAWMRNDLSVYDPPALQLPVDAHETEVTHAAPPLFRAWLPGTTAAAPHVPLFSLTTNACSRLEPSAYDPPALHWPAAAHDTDPIFADPPLFRAAVPGTWIAVPHRPRVSPATNAWTWPTRSVYDPPALQAPAAAQDTDATLADPPLLRAAVPGTSIARPHRPRAWLTTNAWTWPEPSV